MTAEKPIRILLADDHHVVRLGLASLFDFEASMEICGFAEDGLQVVEAYREHHPDVVLMDLRLPGIDGVEATQRIRDESPEARILLLSAFDTDQDINRAIRAGAAGYLVKNTPADELIAAIQAVHRGEEYFTEEITARMNEIRKADDLSARQSEVLGWLAKGLTNREIGDQMGISEDGVKAHLKVIFTKLHAADRTEAVAVAIHRGYLREE
ncbi:DNA-binding response regulator [Haloferula helveola]|uniref:DNA-binding response regulator n=1 Tax=Haloferula helveola TaxID=490095 RepID=A0ABM7RG28_9BACT|nr:DNA-binding response regulator [Haloferula helveola]